MYCNWVWVISGYTELTTRSLNGSPEVFLPNYFWPFFSYPISWLAELSMSTYPPDFEYPWQPRIELWPFTWFRNLVSSYPEEVWEEINCLISFSIYWILFIILLFLGISGTYRMLIINLINWICKYSHIILWGFFFKF